MQTHKRGSSSLPASQDAELMAGQLAELDAFDARNIQEALDALSAHDAYSSSTTAASSSRFCLQQAAKHAVDNRWSDILPYTHALLPGPYLNASFIPSLSPSSSTPARTFICSQAPLPHTYSTFYASLAAHSTRVLVNLTPLQENGRAKSDAYWPDAGAGWVDEYAEDGARWRIRTAEERQLGAKGSVVGELTRRVLQLERVGKGGKADKKHQVVMLHLTTWPDHGAASSRTFQALLQAIDAECAAAPAVPNAKAKGAVPPGSVWVHCSAGVGRSGTVVGALLARDSPEAVVALSTGAAPPSPPASAAAKQSSVKSILKPFKSRHSPSHSSGTSPALSTTPAAAAETQLHLPSAAIAASAIVRHMRERRARMVQTAAQLAMLTAEVERVLGAQQQV